MSVTSMGELAERGSPSKHENFFKNIVRVLDELYPNDWRDWVVNDLSYKDLKIEILKCGRLRFAIPTISLLKAFVPDSKPLRLNLYIYKLYTRIRRILIKWPLGRALIYWPCSLKAKIHYSCFDKFNETIHDLKPKLISLTQAAKILEAERDKRTKIRFLRSKRGHKPDPPCVAEEPKLSEFMAEQSKVLGKVGEMMQHSNEILLMEECKESSQPITYDDSLMSQSVSARSEDASSNCSANIEDIEEENCTALPLTEEACVPEKRIRCEDVANICVPTEFECQYYIESDDDGPSNDMAIENGIGLQEETVRSSDPEHSICVPEEISQEKSFSPEIQPTSANETLTSTMKQPSILTWLDNKNSDTVVTYSGPRKKIASKFQSWEDVEESFFTLYAILDHDYARGPLSGYKINSRIKNAKRRIAQLRNTMKNNNLTLSLLKCDSDTDSASSVVTYKCRYCASEYLHRHDLLNHIEERHLDIRQELIFNKKVNEDIDGAKSIETYKCDYCDIEYKYETDLLRHVEQHLAEQEEEETLDIKPEIYQSSQNNGKKSKENYHFTYSVCTGKDYENTNNGEEQSSVSLDNFSGYNFAELRTETDIKKEFCGPLEDVELPMEDQNFDDNLRSNLYDQNSDFSESHSNININICGTTVGPANEYSPNVDQNNINRMPEPNAFTKNQDYNWSRINNPVVIKCNCCKILFPNQEELLDHTHDIINTKFKFCANVKPVMHADSVEFNKPKSGCDDDTFSSFMDTAKSLDNTQLVFDKPEEERASNPSVTGHSATSKPKKSKPKCIRCSGRIRNAKGGKRRICFTCRKSENGEKPKLIKTYISLENPRCMFCFRRMRNVEGGKRRICLKCKKSLQARSNTMQPDSVQFNKPESSSDDDTDSSFIDTAKSLDNTQLVFDKSEEERVNSPSVTCHSLTSKPYKPKPKCIRCSGRLRNVAGSKRRICLKCKKSLQARSNTMQADSVQFNKHKSGCEDDSNSSFMYTAKSQDNTQLVFDKTEEERASIPSVTGHSSTSKPKKSKRKCIRCSGRVKNVRGGKRRICFACRKSEKDEKPRCILCFRRLMNVAGGKRRICLKCQTSLQARSNTMQPDSVQFNKPESSSDDDTDSSFIDTAKSLDNTQLVFHKPEKERVSNPSVTGHSSTSKPYKSKPKCIRCSGRLRNVAGSKRRICFKCQKSLQERSNTMQADSVQFNKHKSGCEDDSNSSFMDTAKSQDNTQLVFDKTEEERASNPSVTGHSSTSKPKKSKRKCIRCSGRVKNVRGGKRRICFTCRKSEKDEKPRCILCFRRIMNVAGGKRRICLKCQTTLQARSNTMQPDSVQFNKPESSSDDDTDSSFIDTAKSLDNMQLVFDKPEEERAINPSVTGHSLTSKPYKSKPKCIRCSGRLRNVAGSKSRICFICRKSEKDEKPRCILCFRRIMNVARGKRRICVICQKSLKARSNTWQKIIQLKTQMKISHARTEERKFIPVDNDLLKPLPKEELENLQRSKRESQKKNSCIKIDELTTVDTTDLLKPLRIEDEKIIVQPRDPTVCKYCLKPLEKIVKSGQNNALCSKCQSIETSNEVGRKSYEEIKISDLLLCIPDFIAEVSEPNSKVDSHHTPIQYVSKIQSTQTLKKDKLRISKDDTKCSVKLERIIVHGCHICRSKFINESDLVEHVTRYHL